MELQYARIARRPVLVPERPVYLLYGREQVLLEEALGKLLAGVRQDAGADPDVQTLYGSAATCEVIASELANLSLLGGGKVVVVREAQRMRAPEQTRLAALVPRLAMGALLVLMAGEPTYDSRTKRRRVLGEKLETAVREAGVTVAAPAFSERDAERWLLAEAKEAGIDLETEAAGHMVLLAGADLVRLRNELAKVVAYIGGTGRATVADIELVVSRSPEATVFELIDAIGDRRPDRALSALKILLDGGEPEQRILALIARQVRLIWQAKWLAEQGYLKRGGAQVPLEVVRDLLPRERATSIMSQIHQSFLREKLLRQAAAFSWPAVRQGLERVLAADLAMKGIEGEVDDPRLILEVLVLELAN
ncbi:MAG: DNA polymerase III subunit delta [Armatimonadetes bacterium]|nr:DNA polymerase III subunit delta [Armatimonadota bacterium]